MQPVATLRRPASMRPMSRVLAAFALAVGTTALPATTAFACSCAFFGYEEAIAAADVAFIGTVVAEEGEQVIELEQFPTARTAFEVSHSKESMASPFVLDVASGGGASCGLDMSIGEEWLVIASAWEGRLSTDLCTGTTLTNDVDPGELNRIKLALPLNDSIAVADDSGFTLDVPAPVIGVLAAALLIGAVGMLAFRRDGLR